MNGRQLITDAQNTWCPGCGNFVIQHTLKEVLQDLEKEGTSLDDVVLVTGIGCHAKMADYLNINTFYSIHGRVLPVATAIKLANPGLTVIGCAGDGDAYAEGLDHLIFAAKRNIDITLFIHNNRVYGLTTGQVHPHLAPRVQGEVDPVRYTGVPPQPAGTHVRERCEFHCEGVFPQPAAPQEDHGRGDPAPGLLLRRHPPDLRHVLRCPRCL